MTLSKIFAILLTPPLMALAKALLTGPTFCVQSNQAMFETYIMQTEAARSQQQQVLDHHRRRSATLRGGRNSSNTFYNAVFQNDLGVWKISLLNAYYLRYRILCLHIISASEYFYWLHIISASEYFYWLHIISASEYFYWLHILSVRVYFVCILSPL